jgi:hypothetical protein
MVNPVANFAPPLYIKIVGYQATKSEKSFPPVVISTPHPRNLVFLEQTDPLGSVSI